MSKCEHWDDQNITEEKQAKWHSKGIREKQCTVCKKWFWPHEWEKKPAKPKVRRVKAWAVVRGQGEIDGFEAGNLPPKHFSSAYVPCTILIDEKYLKGGK